MKAVAWTIHGCTENSINQPHACLSLLINLTRSFFLIKKYHPFSQIICCFGFSRYIDFFYACRYMICLRYVIKVVYLSKPKQPINWNGRSNIVSLPPPEMRGKLFVPLPPWERLLLLSSVLYSSRAGHALATNGLYVHHAKNQSPAMANKKIEPGLHRDVINQAHPTPSM
jgi:hypothetical protein